MRVDLPAPMKAHVDRWELLRDRSNNGWVSLAVFLEVFKIKYTGLPKHAMARVKKKLVDTGCEVKKKQSHPWAAADTQLQWRVCATCDVI